MRLCSYRATRLLWLQARGTAMALTRLVDEMTNQALGEEGRQIPITDRAEEEETEVSTKSHGLIPQSVGNFPPNSTLTVFYFNKGHTISV